MLYETLLRPNHSVSLILYRRKSVTTTKHSHGSDHWEIQGQEAYNLVILKSFPSSQSF